ncbi:MAG: tRNA threonylcarbamoyladenosine dehydratase [Bacilli bacterium]|nr:tRNA threonylcarbamoyladenosine dehydratase [Bacilli bacterium]
MSQFDRLELLIKDKINDIFKKKVLVIGLGGVGSYAVEALIRSGIQNITIVDNDTISLSNLNRQLMTYQNNIGKFKTDEIEKRILDINPNCIINKITKFITTENINELFNNEYDYVVDACDTISVKLELIRICKNKNIKLISCMGTGNKMDPSKLKIIDIRKTTYDPIAKIIRKMVKDERIKGKVMVVCSDEQAYTKVSKEIPSNSFVPATAGLLCASYIINDIVGENNV